MADSVVSTEALPSGTRIACRIEYDGRAYNGWQSQPSQIHEKVSTVQDALESALSAVADAPVRVHCSGRTDSGVHGFAQVVHFDAPSVRSCKAWLLGGNTNLPFDIRIHWAMPVPVDFHARFSATARHYRYIIANTLVSPALLHRQVCWHRRPLDEMAMHRAAQCLLGEQDFSAFRAASCQANTATRNITLVNISRHDTFVVMDIQANAFLQHMVRNIAGSLVAVGDGRQGEEWLGDLLRGRDRSVAADTATASGLYFVDVAYPAHYALPATSLGPLFPHG